MPNITIKDFIQENSNYLRQYQIPNPEHDVALILSHYLQIEYLELFLQPNRMIMEDEPLLPIFYQAGKENCLPARLRQAIEERSTRKPLQYILGNVHFANCYLEVNESVLIPRPETEFMVDYIRRNEVSPKYILDLGTGSGAVAIALKKYFPRSQVYAIDICQRALQMAKQNAKLNNCEIKFLRSNLFVKFFSSGLKFDLIVSNPPYVNIKDYPTLQPEIFFEPKKALVAKDQGLFFLKKIISSIPTFLSNHGVLYLEIGSEQKKDLTRFINQRGWKNFWFIQDLQGLDRILKISSTLDVE